ncbi:MAG: class I SAM-dependent methyltransferase [bacterium]
MDDRTINSYNLTASETASFHSTLIPTEIYQLIKRFFVKELPVLDIGCGSGRDCQWLSNKGYKVDGADASEQMLKQATGLYKNINFFKESLPYLKTIQDEKYGNILCSAVIMHLDEDSIEIAIENLLRVLKNDGIIIFMLKV